MKEQFIENINNIVEKYLQFNSIFKGIAQSPEEHQNYFEKSGLKKLLDDVKYLINFCSQQLIKGFQTVFNKNFIEFKFHLLYIFDFLEHNKYIISMPIKYLSKESNKLVSFYLYIYSMLDKLISLKYLIDNKNFVDSKLAEAIKQKDLSIIESIFKKISFTSEKYNPIIIQVKKSSIWGSISRSRNKLQHRSIFYEAYNFGDLENYYFEFEGIIYFTIFIFLWHLKEYALIK